MPCPANAGKFHFLCRGKQTPSTDRRHCRSKATATAAIQVQNLSKKSPPSRRTLPKYMTRKVSLLTIPIGLLCNSPLIRGHVFARQRRRERGKCRCRGKSSAEESHDCGDKIKLMSYVLNADCHIHWKSARSTDITRTI